MILDCTLRDGGYTNNWNFSFDYVCKYLNDMKQSNIKKLEIGYRSLVNNKEYGIHWTTPDDYIKTFNIDKDISIGVMVNVKEISDDVDRYLSLLFPIKSRIDFVRLAVHVYDIEKVSPCVNWLKKQGYEVHVNVMKISEYSLDVISSVVSTVSDTNADVLYFADSLGKLNNIQSVYNTAKLQWNKQLGFHGHNDETKTLALSNSIFAKEIGVDYIDCTVAGIGRGYGNTDLKYMIRHWRKNNT